MNGFNLYFTEDGFRAEVLPEAGEEARKWVEAWKTDSGKALYDYGMLPPENETPVTAYAHKLTDTFLKKLTDLPELEMLRERVKIQLEEEDFRLLLESLPFALGTESVNRAWLTKVFKELNAAFKQEIQTYDGTVALYLEEKHQNLHVPERIFFHLVENKEEGFPFAFLATYASRISAAKVGHYPLKYALKEYDQDRRKLVELLKCLNGAAEVSPLIAELMSSGELFHPLKLTEQEAYAFLKDVPAIESTGILCRIPNWWRSHAATPHVSVTILKPDDAKIGMQTLLTLLPSLTIDGVELTREEAEELLRQTEGLARIKGKWIEINHAKLNELLLQLDQMGGRLSLLDALRMESGIAETSDSKAPSLQNAAWIGEMLQKLRNPKEIKSVKPPKDFCAKLRPYQKTGYQWLNTMSELGFGACLADDMGLGKTIQVLAYLDTVYHEEPEAKCLLIVPASLLGNWQKEAEKFTPGLPLEVFHGRSADDISSDLLGRNSKQLPFLAITTYGMALRVEAFQKLHYRCLILDEAQAIKNSTTKQTKAVKSIQADMKIAMTGTPIENDLGNLWSLYDFLNHGLLGSMAEFKRFTEKLSDHPEHYAKLRAMISPFLLRRMKSDKSIIRDLPDKIEMVEYASLSAKQTVLYHSVVSNLEQSLAELSGIERKGVVLSTIMKLKQICNHPDQYLGGEAFEEEESGKLELLRELCETIRDKHERVLVFTQFREIIPALQSFLTGLFGKEGYCIHGGTPVAQRTKIVDAFQGDDYVPFLILSVKAGGTGLNLTKAGHVIHFDRWWNPAVENQATDRAYRIGQKSNVMVHKLVCKNTIEEKIDAIINAKKELAENVITASAGESWITELSNDELVNLLKLG